LKNRQAQICPKCLSPPLPPIMTIIGAFEQMYGFAQR
jgi:hypothetical protein